MVNWLFGFALLIGLVLQGCATHPLRLGPGECLAIVEKYEVIVVGSDCDVRRLNR